MLNHSPATPVHRIREIPYNYTSHSDREVVCHFLGESTWEIISELRDQRVTGRSAKLLFEVLGDMWVVFRNPFIFDDLVENPRRRRSLIDTLNGRLEEILRRANGQPTVMALHAEAVRAVADFSSEFERVPRRRREIKQRLEQATRKDNILFDGLSRVSHVTDATDWRVEYPFVVITPDTEDEVAELVRACIELDLVIVPRGGGTGYTGGAIPLVANTAVINTEKLENMSAVIRMNLAEGPCDVPVVHAECGVVTRRISDLAARHGLAFAVDPTSQDSSTIGGNIAMNAGGKKAVLWGTTLDSLVSWRMVDAQGRWLEVVRLDHNLGKIHVVDRVRFRINHLSDSGKPSGDAQIIEVNGRSLRRTGLGKDVTDKFLGGIPGVQKEGCDGIVTSAVFVLHRMPQHTYTLSLEFFDPDLGRAVPAVVEIRDMLEARTDVLLAGLEHLDDRYIKAVGYTTKASQNNRVRMLLLADIASDDVNALDTVVHQVMDIAKRRGAEGFVARTNEARERFWAPRKRTAAIAAHTNAFKINEDVVIPLERLAEYSKEIERINIEYSLRNKISMASAIGEYLQSYGRDADADASPLEGDEEFDILQQKRLKALPVITIFMQRIEGLVNHLDDRVDNHASFFEPDDGIDPTDSSTILDLFLQRRFIVSITKSVLLPLKELFDGELFTEVRQQIEKIHGKVLRQRLFVALHMHAGDGNVHTNIPVNSNDYVMLHEAERIVDRVMKLATSLNGVISGEHGIGLTKIAYLDDDSIDAFARYKAQVDPGDVFNRGKLRRGFGLTRAYTPSLRLLQQEALILEASELGALNDDIRNCLRCGKCKPVCTTHVPGANLLYSPRDKILATGLVIEAFLYEDQTRRGLSTRHFEELNDIADHCTICHRCEAPCPVNIDFGDVTMRMRKILKDRGQRKFNPGAYTAMAFLNTTSPWVISALRRTMIGLGYPLQSLASKLARPLIKKTASVSSRTTTGKSSGASVVVHFVNRPLPKLEVRHAMRELLSIEDREYIPLIKPSGSSKSNDAVFYFPGCGSERLFSEISLATLALLRHVNARTVLPPGYLCCGYPQRSAGDEQKGRQITTDNRVLFHRVANTLSYLDINTVVVSCGTCMDQVLDYRFDKIFPGCRLLDIHEYLMEQGVSINRSDGARFVYHDPCHSPMKTHDPLAVGAKLLGAEMTPSDRCCGEAGTFAVSRPDIATQVRFSKQRELEANIETARAGGDGDNSKVRLLTSCPSCKQGLSRYRDTTGLDAEYIVEVLANELIGTDWKESFINEMNAGAIERVQL